MWLLTYLKPNLKVPMVLCERSTIELLQIEKKKLVATGKYRLGKLQIRTKKGFENVKVLDK
jgi:hypothetical protein